MSERCGLVGLSRKPACAWLQLPLLLWISAIVAAQSPATTDKLDRLLEELKTIPAEAWEARWKKLEADIEAQRKRAADLRAEMQKLEREAAQAEAEAKALRADLERERAWKAALEAKSPTKPAPAPSGASPPKAGPPPIDPSKSPEPKKDESKDLLTYTDSVRPIFEQHCLGCHNAQEQKGGLDLSTSEGTLRGGGSGAVIAAKDARGSRLYRLAAHLDTPTMPPGQGKIPEAELERLRLWIEQGAHANRDDARKATESPAASQGAPVPTASAEPASSPPLPTVRIDRVPPKDLPLARTIATSPSAPLLAKPGRGEVLFLDSTDGTILSTIPLPFEHVEVLRFGRDGEHLLVAGGVRGRKGALALCDVRKATVLRHFEVGSDVLLAAALSPRESILACGGPERVVRILNAETGVEVGAVKEHQDWVLALDFSPDGNYLASGDRLGGLFVSEAPTGLNVHQLKGHEGAIHALQFAPDAKSVASLAEDGGVRVHNVENGQIAWNVNGAHRGAALSLAYRKSDHTLATAGQDGQIRVFSRAGKPVASTPVVQDWIYALAFSHDGQRLFAVPWSGELATVDAATWKPLAPSQ